MTALFKAARVFQVGIKTQLTKGGNRLIGCTLIDSQPATMGLLFGVVQGVEGRQHGRTGGGQQIVNGARGPPHPQKQKQGARAQLLQSEM